MGGIDVPFSGRILSHKCQLSIGLPGDRNRIDGVFHLPGKPIYLFIQKDSEKDAYVLSDSEWGGWAGGRASHILSHRSPILVG